MPALASSVPKPAPLKPYTRITLFEPAASVSRSPPTPRTPDLDQLATDLGFAPAPAYPTTPSARAGFRTSAGKAVSPHAWSVYDYLLAIPKGKVSTYGQLAKAIGSSPRAVGGALRSNPFAPVVPCHRVIASTLFVGGFQGDWPAAGGAGRGDGAKQDRKLALLGSEGVKFDGKGYLMGGRSVLWEQG